MKIQPEEQHENGGQLTESVAISLEVKLAFSRLSSLIYTLKDDIGQEAANYQLLRIRNDIAKVLKSKVNREFFKEEKNLKEPQRKGKFRKGLKTNLEANGNQSEREIKVPANNSKSQASSTNKPQPPMKGKNKKTNDTPKTDFKKSKCAIDSKKSDEKNLKEPQRKRKFRKGLKTNLEANGNQSEREVKAPAYNSKSQASSTNKPQPSMKGKNKKTNDTPKTDLKKSKCAIDSKKSDELALEKNRTNKKSENGLDKDKHGPFPEIFEGESSFILPMPSLTIDDLLDSVEKNVINGRYTPPTSIFDNVYGNKSINNSSVNTSLGDIGVKNDHVVKRMCKVNKKANAKKKYASQRYDERR